MKVSLRRTAGAWLGILLFLLLEATNCFATVLCIEPDGSTAVETIDTHGRCAPCPGSTKSSTKNKKEQSQSTSDHCVDLKVVNSPDIKAADTVSAAPAEFMEVETTLRFVSWFNTFLQAALADVKAPGALYDTPVPPTTLYFARSVVLLV